MDAWAWWWEWKNDNNELAPVVLTFSVVLIAISWFIWVRKKINSGSLPPLPPGPRELPVVGNLPFVDPELHRYFAKLTDKYGPIFKLKLGRKLVIVLGSSALAEVVLKEHDTTFADRDASIAALTVTYGGLDMAFSSYGPHWRMVRLLCVQEILSKNILESLSTLRRQEIHRTLWNLYSKINTPINIGDEMFLTMLNVIMNMLWGGTFNDEDKARIGSEFRLAAVEVLYLLGKTNISDLFPVLASFDIQGVERRMKELLSWLDRFFDTIIEQRMELDQRVLDGEDQMKKSTEFKDFVQVILQLKYQGDPKTPFTTTHMKALFMNLVIGGTDTSAVTVEWAIAELIKHPEIMKKAQEELDDVVGRNHNVDESHLPKLSYLAAILKETLRMHPPVPLLIPRCSKLTSTVGGYTIPKGTQVLVNAWAIQMDPKNWENPLEFQPERYSKNPNKPDFIGTDFRFIPFGSGRRKCVGIPLVEKMVPYTLASLLHSFEWRMPEGSKIDLEDRFGIVLKKRTPLIAIPKPRLSHSELYSYKE